MRFPIDSLDLPLRFCRRFRVDGQKLAKKLEFQQFEQVYSGGEVFCAEPRANADTEQFEQVVCQPILSQQEQLQSNVGEPVDTEPLQFDICQPQSQPVDFEPEQFEQDVCQEGAEPESFEHDQLEPLHSQPEQFEQNVCRQIDDRSLQLYLVQPFDSQPEQFEQNNGEQVFAEPLQLYLVQPLDSQPKRFEPDNSEPACSEPVRHDIFQQKPEQIDVQPDYYFEAAQFLDFPHTFFKHLDQSKLNRFDLGQPKLEYPPQSEQQNTHRQIDNDNQTTGFLFDEATDHKHKVEYRQSYNRKESIRFLVFEPVDREFEQPNKFRQNVTEQQYDSHIQAVRFFSSKAAGCEFRQPVGFEHQCVEVAHWQLNRHWCKAAGCKLRQSIGHWIIEGAHVPRSRLYNQQNTVDLRLAKVRYAQPNCGREQHG